MNEINARDCARRLLEFLRDDKEHELGAELARLTEDRAAGGMDTHRIVFEFVTALVQMTKAVAGPDAEASYALELTDDDGVVIPIDDMRPSVRAAVRAVLAQLNGHHEDTAFQLTLALREPTVETTTDVLAHCLMWTTALLRWCDESSVTRPEWLRDLATSRPQ